MSVLTSLVGKVSALSAVAVAVIGMAAPTVASANQGPSKGDCSRDLCFDSTPHCLAFKHNSPEADTHFVCAPYQKGKVSPKYL